MNPPRKGVAWAALVALAVGVGLGVYWYWPKFLTIFQEGNPLPVALAVAKLELTGAEIVPVTPDETKLIQKSGSEEPLTRFLACGAGGSRTGWELQFFTRGAGGLCWLGPACSPGATSSMSSRRSRRS